MLRLGRRSSWTNLGPHEAPCAASDPRRSSPRGRATGLVDVITQTGAEVFSATTAMAAEHTPQAALVLQPIQPSLVLLVVCRDSGLARAGTVLKHSDSF